MINNLEKIIEESIEIVLVDYIVEKVVEKLLQSDKKALVVFTGATIGFKQSIEGLKRLKSEGWKIEVVLSNAALKIFTESLIKELLEIEEIIKEDENIDVHKLVEKNSLIIIPTLTSNSCSKIVNCISDSIATNIISYGLMMGKNIIASIDACCPDNKERISLFGDNLSLARKETFRNNIVKVKKHGIIITNSENIDYKVNKIFKNKFYIANNKLTEAKGNKVKNNYYEKSFSDEVYLDKKIISRADIYENRNFKNIKVNNNSIITDLAKEEALNLKIEILK